MIESTTPPDTVTDSQTVTFTVSAADAHWVRAALVDSATYWHELWQDAESGRRPDLNPESCLSINRRAWRLYQDLSTQEMQQLP